MNRQMRRETQRDWDRVFARKTKHIDPTKPLVFPGRWEYIHDRCGGEVDRANAITHECARCDRIVASDECRRMTKAEREDYMRRQEDFVPLLPEVRTEGSDD
jgi:hypothetical protein